MTGGAKYSDPGIQAAEQGTAAQAVMQGTAAQAVMQGTAAQAVMQGTAAQAVTQGAAAQAVTQGAAAQAVMQGAAAQAAMQGAAAQAMTQEAGAQAMQEEQIITAQPAQAVKSKLKKKKRSAKSYAIAFFIKVGLTVLAVFIALKFIAGVHVCHVNSAYPMIKDGDFCLTYRLADIKQGTMVVYKHNSKVKYGRIIAFGGEKVDIQSDFVSVNDYGISENVVYPTTTEGAAVSFPYTVPDNCVFVLNDFRSDLNDSRVYGGIPLAEVEGAVIFTMRMRGI